MLQVELDIFSGCPNPTWSLTGKEEKELVDRIIANPKEMAPVYSAEYDLGLGYRGLIIRQVKQDGGAWSMSKLSSGIAFPSEFRIGVNVKLRTTMDWLLLTSEKKETTVSDFLREIASTNPVVVTVPSHTIETAGTPNIGTPPEGAPMCCSSTYLNDNRWAFNQSSYVGITNCYCFASNHLTNARYAKPGCRGGRPAKRPYPLSEMKAGLAADKWSESCQARNNLMIAVVVWPGYPDYHFYRLVSTSGYRWAHKPGATPARDTDDSGKVISSPENCNRGPYTSFYGYWYQDNNTAYVAQC